MKLRNRASQSWPLLRNNSAMMLFQVDGSNWAGSRETVRLFQAVSDKAPKLMSRGLFPSD
jgi:hypothetical protein